MKLADGSLAASSQASPRNIFHKACWNAHVNHQNCIFQLWGATAWTGFPTRTRLPFYSQLRAGLGQCCLLPTGWGLGVRKGFKIGYPGLPFLERELLVLLESLSFWKQEYEGWNPETVASEGLWGSQCYDWAEVPTLGCCGDFGSLPDRAKLLPESSSFPGKNDISCENVTQGALFPFFLSLCCSQL